MASPLNVNNWEEKARWVFVYAQARSRVRASVFWVTQCTSGPNIESVLTAWLTSHDQTRRGRACGTCEHMDGQLAQDEWALCRTGRIQQKLCCRWDRSGHRAPSCHAELAA
jgi:hypothetical protein